MSHVLFVTWDGGGNVPPAFAIAAQLRERGDDVRFLGHEGQRASIEGHGFRFASYTHARPWEVLETRSGPAAALGYAGVFTDKGMGEDIAAAMAHEPTDFAVIDGLLVGAMRGAARAGLPYSVLVHTLLSVMDATLNRGPLALIARLKGLNPRKLYEGADRVIVATLDTLDTAPSGSHAIYTGPMVTGSPATVERPPVVLVSLSTTYIKGQREVIQTILDSLADLPVSVVVTTGPAVSPAALVSPANAEVHEFVPHAELMPRASLLVGHGGHATTMVALAHGVPMIVLPMSPTFDQPTIGRFIEQRGAGMALKRTASAAEIRATAERVLSDDTFRAAAEALGAQIRQHDAAALAADALHGARLAGRVAAPPAAG
ncbi:MAG: glycosyltransferase [Rhodoglobus sp.]